MKERIMKKITMLSAVMMLAAAGYAQDVPGSQVPSVVINTFKQQFPKATNTEWEVNKGVYEAEFEVNRLDHEVWINHQGQIVKHKEEIKPRNVPDTVKKGAKQQFKGYRITEAAKLQQRNGTVYQLELTSLTKENEVIVDEKGQVIEGYIW